MSRSVSRSNHITVPITGEILSHDFPPVRECSTVELLDELQRRSRGCLIALAEDQRNSHRWLYRIKGSRNLMNTLSAGLTLEMHSELLRR